MRMERRRDMQSRIVVSAFLLIVVLAFSSWTSHQAEAQAAAPVEVGQTYRILVGVGALSFRILEIGEGGLVRVQAVEDASFVGVGEGSVWWLNLNQALLVEAKPTGAVGQEPSQPSAPASPAPAAPIPTAEATAAHGFSSASIALAHGPIGAPLPTLAFLDESCRGQAVRFLGEGELGALQQHYESASEDVRVHLALRSDCLTMLDVTRAEAHRIIAETVHEMRAMKIPSLRQGYWGTSYAHVRVVEAPDVFRTDFMVAEEHGPEVTVNPYHFGFFVFEYVPEHRWLRVHGYRYEYSPGL